MRDARRWMKAASDHGATLSFAPNFAFALAALRADAAHVAELDLSRLRVLGCGAEPISPDVLRRFASVYAPAGLRASAIRPCYGMAEATLAMTFAPADGLHTLHVRREVREGEAVEMSAAASDVEVVSCGICIADHAIEIEAADGALLPERTVGRIAFRGPSVSPGYVEDPEGTRDVFGSGSLRTGDLGFLHRGHLYLVGRHKDLVIVNGRNYSPQVIERAVEAVPGSRLGSIAAFSINDDRTERLVVAAETRRRDTEALACEIRDAVMLATGLGRIEVWLISPGQLPKTTSGKLRRTEVRRLFLQSLSSGPTVGVRDGRELKLSDRP
jgi:fatty-acyl-CoA synthase